MPINKYFKVMEDEAQLDADFARELRDNPLAVTRETAKFFLESTEAKLDRYRCSRLAYLLNKLLELAEAANTCEIADAFRDGWENGWSSCRAKVGVPDTTYSADDFDPDWDASQTKNRLG